VHSPFDAKDELVEKYRALADPANPQRNPVYAAMVESLDDAVGRVVSALEENGVLEKTVIVFFSDNGGVSWGAEGGGKEHKSARFQADMKSPPTSNLPLRNGKASLYEGGVREPCIVVWPGVAKPGTSNDTLIQSIDWMPTLLDIAGVPMPAEVKPDGLSLVPVLKGEKLSRDTLFCHFPHDTPASGQHPGASVRRGDMKLIRLFAQNDDGSDQFELYDLKADLGETKNLATEKPALVRELAALLDGFLKDTEAVIPKRNPAYKAAGAPAPEVKNAPKAKPQAAASTSPSRPNILFILTEDQGAHMAALGTRGIATPHMDALAASGTLFTRAYVNYPVCSASKACIYTGLHPHSNGLLNNTKNFFKPAGELTPDERENPAYKNIRIRSRGDTLVESLKKLGYHCGITGKLHVSPSERFPYDEFIRGGQPLARLAKNAAAQNNPGIPQDTVEAHGEGKPDRHRHFPKP
jgi:arylsulfatase A-like enzyme